MEMIGQTCPSYFGPNFVNEDFERSRMHSISRHYANNRAKFSSDAPPLIY